MPQENLQAIALEIKAAQDECRRIQTLTSRIADFNTENGILEHFPFGPVGCVDRVKAAAALGKRLLHRKIRRKP